MRNRIFTRYFVALITFLFIACVGATGRSNDQPGTLSADDEKAIKATIEAYRTAWLENDAKRVLKTFTDDAVLLPAHGAPAVSGIAAIEKYWFTPGGPTTTVTKL
ncbi:MAG TPA: SgcJ/EcaC family oxidoreductase, partial [Candidatus Angelobacter sp.]|nr:SgcJ/EcaC family oxidoreductase [Candidatus Angelobacter sp.]